MILISHNLADVFEVADDIAVLYLGQMVAQIPTSETTRDDVVGYITGTKTPGGVTIIDTSTFAPKEERNEQQRDPDRGRTRSRSPSDLIGSGVEGGLGDQVQAWWQRVRGGDMGALPAIGGLVVLGILFSILSPFFLTERNFANLLNQAATLVVLGMALVFVLLLGEIDLSAGVTGGVGMALFVVLNAPVRHPVAARAADRLRLRLPHRRAHRLLRREGRHPVVRRHAGPVPRASRASRSSSSAPAASSASRCPSSSRSQNGNLPVWGGWVMLAIMLAISAGTSFWDRARRTRAGVPNRADLAGVDQARRRSRCIGGAVVFVLNQNRGQSVNAVAGRADRRADRARRSSGSARSCSTARKFGRYIYAIGGNAEAARRSGVKVRWIKWWAFVICSSLAVFSALLSVSRVGSVDATVGRDIVLSGVAAAVVGGVSLFGGRGRLMHAAIGALVIAVITNGLGLLNLPAGINLLVTGAVLILAATVDALSRLRSGGGSRT